MIQSNPSNIKDYVIKSVLINTESRIRELTQKVNRLEKLLDKHVDMLNIRNESVYPAGREEVMYCDSCNEAFVSTEEDYYDCELCSKIVCDKCYFDESNFNTIAICYPCTKHYCMSCAKMNDWDTFKLNCPCCPANKSFDAYLCETCINLSDDELLKRDAAITKSNHRTKIA